MDQEKRKQQLRDAVRRHDSKVDKVAVRLPKGSKEAILSTGKSVNAYVVEAVIAKMAADNLFLPEK